MRHKPVSEALASSMSTNKSWDGMVRAACRPRWWRAVNSLDYKRSGGCQQWSREPSWGSHMGEPSQRGPPGLIPVEIRVAKIDGIITYPLFDIIVLRAESAL